VRLSGTVEYSNYFLCNIFKICWG